MTTTERTTRAGTERPVLPRIAQGDRDAVELCMRRYGSLVWTVARRFLGNETDAEDAVQDIFADLWARADRFDPDQAAEKTWVMMIARRRLIDRRRREARRPQATSLEFEPRAEDGPREDPADRDDLTRARRAMAELRPEQQDVLRLVLVEGYSHAAAAEKLELPLGTVKTHARRGLAALRSRLGVKEAPPEGGGS